MRAIQALVVIGVAGLLANVRQASGQSGNGGGLSAKQLKGLEFRMVGPTRGGRVTAVTGVAEQTSTFYMGATGGGVWKTTDFGHTWSNISDGFFATASIGAIDVADSDANVIYVGTGSDAIRSNVIIGRGVYKSKDAGKTWSFVGLKDAGQIGAVVIHPTNPDVVYIAAIGNPFAPSRERGVYRSTDGGASWKNVLFVSDSTGAVDLELAPDNPNEVYASLWRGERRPWTIISGAREGGLYKSVDGGENWTKLRTGLPSGLFGKSDLAVSRAAPERVYALIEAPVGEGGVYRSDNRGESWTLVTTNASLLDRPFYYTNIDADPTNADRLFVNSTGFYISPDAGKTWRGASTPHGDNHDMWINPRDPNLWVQGNDGGASVTRDGGRTWSTLLNQPTAELYQVAVDDRRPYWLYAGQQDNATVSLPSLPPTAGFPEHPSAWWLDVGGCETGPAVPKPGDPDVVYSNCKGQFGRFSRRTGQEQVYWVGARDLYGQNPKYMRDRFQRVAPIHVSPHKPYAVYHTSQYVYKTLDEGKTWVRISPDLTLNPAHGQVFSGEPITRDITGEEYYSTIYAIRESPHEPGVILVGTNDGLVQITKNGGKSWTNITPPDLAPGGRVQHVEWSPHRPGSAYVAIYRFLLGDFKPYGYATNDYGKTWTRLTTGSNGIPDDFPVRVIVEDPSRQGLLYAGTEFGLFLSFDGGKTWEAFENGFPVTPVTDLVVHRQDLIVSTMGRSFWILDDLTPLHQLADSVAVATVHLFQPRDVYRQRYSGGRGNRSEAQYIGPGVNLDYHLGAAAAGEIRLDILDAKGTLLRSFSSESPGESYRVPEQPTMRKFELERVGTPRLPKAQGHNRFRWDFSLAGPWSPNAGQSGRGGPWIVPGSYQARLVVGGTTMTRRFRVLMDPKVQAEGVTQADLESQLATSLAVRDLLSNWRLLVQEVANLKKELTARAGATASSGLEAERQRLTALEGRLQADRSMRYPTPGLVDQMGHLFGMTRSADQRLGADVTDRFAELKGEYEKARSELDGIRNRTK